MFIVFIERSQRRLLIQYPKRQQGNRMVGGRIVVPAAEGEHRRRHPADLRVLAADAADDAGELRQRPGANAAGWWSAALQFIQAYWATASRCTLCSMRVLIIFFCFFYTSIMFNPEETAENLRKYGGFIPGIRPGKRTAEYLDYVLTRLTVIGSIYIAIVCLMPEMLRNQFNGTVLHRRHVDPDRRSVTMDTVAQIQSHLIAHQYEGMIKKSSCGGKKK